MPAKKKPTKKAPAKKKAAKKGTVKGAMSAMKRRKALLDSI